MRKFFERFCAVNDRPPGLFDRSDLLVTSFGTPGGGRGFVVESVGGDGVASNVPERRVPKTNLPITFQDISPGNTSGNSGL